MLNFYVANNFLSFGARITEFYVFSSAFDVPQFRLYNHVLWHMPDFKLSPSVILSS